MENDLGFVLAWTIFIPTWGGHQLLFSLTVFMLLLPALSFQAYESANWKPWARMRRMMSSWKFQAQVYKLFSPAAAVAPPPCPVGSPAGSIWQFRWKDSNPFSNSAWLRPKCAAAIKGHDREGSRPLLLSLSAKLLRVIKNSGFYSLLHMLLNISAKLECEWQTGMCPQHKWRIRPTAGHPKPTLVGGFYFTFHTWPPHCAIQLWHFQTVCVSAGIELKLTDKGQFWGSHRKRHPISGTLSDHSLLEIGIWHHTVCIGRFSMGRVIAHHTSHLLSAP